MIRHRWRLLKHWYFTKILRWQSVQIKYGSGTKCEVVYQCYGYPCEYHITVEVSP